jgi:glyoxylase-like metal-dependent hydrolase (beta-lactamase superfamily II)
MRFSRGGVIAIAWLGLAATPALAAPPAAAAAQADVPLSATAVAPGVYWANGGISNSGFIIGDKGVVVIDAQTFLPTARALLAEVARLTPKSVNAVILTHSDPDHINGLPAFPAGMTIIAQDNAKTEIETAITDPRSNGLPPPAGMKDYLPTHTVARSEILTLDGVRMQLIHTGPAHTDGDLVVFLPKTRVVFAGDLLTPAIGMYPGIHLNKRGSSMGWIASVRTILALDADIFVCGHGEPLTRAEVKARLDASVERRAEIKAMVGKHMSLAEIKAALHDAPLPGPASRFPTFVETTYQELTAQ